MLRWTTAVAIWAAVAGPALAGTGYSVHWTAVEHMLTPTRATVTHRWMDRFSVDGTTFTTYADGTQTTTAPGQAALFTTAIGTSYRVVYARRGETIQQTSTFPGFVERVRVVPGGPSGCRATIVYAKLPGRAVFSSRLMDGRGASTASRVEAANVSCQATAD